MEKPSYYERNKEKIKARSKQRYHDKIKNDPEQAKKLADRNKNNPERMREYRQKWEKKNPAYIMYHNAKARCKGTDIPFDITFRDISIPTHCPVLGHPFEGASREYGPSLDRVNPKGGYTKDNIAVISMRANRLKNDATLEELEALVQYVKEKV